MANESLNRSGKYKAGYICRDCAKSANCTWPKGHAATAHHGICDYCENIVKVVATSDWNWPGKKMSFEEREI
jgi:hypothetical protein